MKHITNINRSVATALLSVLVGTPSNAIYAHSCQLLLGGSKGWGLVAIKGTAVSPRVHYFGGQILSYGVAGNRLAVVASVFPATRRYPHSLRFSLWDTRNERLLGASNLSVVKLRPPPPMEGLIEGGGPLRPSYRLLPGLGVYSPWRYPDTVVVGQLASPREPSDWYHEPQYFDSAPQGCCPTPKGHSGASWRGSVLSTLW